MSRTLHVALALGLAIAGFPPSLNAADPPTVYSYLQYWKDTSTAGSENGQDTCPTQGNSGQLASGTYRAQILVFSSEGPKTVALGWSVGSGKVDRLINLASEQELVPETLTPKGNGAAAAADATVGILQRLAGGARPRYAENLLEALCGRGTATGVTLTRIEEIFSSKRVGDEILPVVRDFVFQKSMSDGIEWSELSRRVKASSAFTEPASQKYKELFNSFKQDFEIAIGGNQPILISDQVNSQRGKAYTENNPPIDPKTDNGSVNIIWKVIAITLIGLIILLGTTFLVLLRGGGRAWLRRRSENDEDVLTLTPGDVQHTPPEPADPPAQNHQEAILKELARLSERAVRLEQLPTIESLQQSAGSTKRLIEEMNKRFAEIGRRLEENTAAIVVMKNDINGLRDYITTTAEEWSELPQALPAPARSTAQPRLIAGPAEGAAATQTQPQFDVVAKVLARDLPLSLEDRNRLASSESMEDFGRRLVAEVIPVRTAHATLIRLDSVLSDMTQNRMRLMIPEVGARPQTTETEVVAERRIDRGVYGLISALVRPGLLIDGRLLRKAEVELGV